MKISSYLLLPFTGETAIDVTGFTGEDNLFTKLIRLLAGVARTLKSAGSELLIVLAISVADG